MLMTALFLFMAVRCFLYFRSGRAGWGVFAALASLLFLSGMYVDFAKHKAQENSAAASI